MYGKPGTGKTDLIAKMAAFVKKTTNKLTRVVTSDGGGIEPLMPGINLGFIKAVDISNWSNPFAAFQFLSSGWWPVDTEVVNSPLMPGFKDWKICPSCGKDCGAKPLAAVKECISCKKPIPSGVILKSTRELINGMEEVGAYGFEGLTSWGDRCQQLQSDKLAMGDLGASAGGDSGKGGSSVRFQDGLDTNGNAVWIAGNAQPHYGISVDYLNRYVRNSDQLPGWKMWTALERVGKEEETKKLIVGPSVPGRAGVDKVIGWFNSVLHLDLITGKVDKDNVIGVERVLYLNTHMAPDAPGVPFTAKVSVTSGVPVPTSIPHSFEIFVNTLEKAQIAEEKRLLEYLK